MGFILKIKEVSFEIKCGFYFTSSQNKDNFEEYFWFDKLSLLSIKVETMWIVIEFHIKLRSFEYLVGFIWNPKNYQGKIYVDCNLILHKIINGSYVDSSLLPPKIHNISKSIFVETMWMVI